jgi:branched-chain amino acid transport system ATP-binding protein
MSEALLRVTGLTAGYGAAPVLNDVSLEVQTGEIVALVGSNGAGKTTLLRAISRLVSARGQITFLGQSLLALRPEAVFALGLVQVPEGRQLFPRMSVEENLRMGARRGQGPLDFGAVFDLFPILRERRRQAAGSLSGGEQQMCAIGRALMASPKLLLIDEMSLGLAPVLVDRLLEALVQIRGRGVPILLVEQDVFAAFSIADRGYVLERGHIVRSGAVVELTRDPALRRAYLGAAEG